MKIQKLTFITPLVNGKTYKLVKQYSHNIILNNDDEINLSSNNGPREEQEDTVAINIRHGYILLLVADGMGGKVRGNEASYIVARQIQRWFSSQSKKKLEQLDEQSLKKT